jgi:iron complex outermembrane recepter protein
MPKLRLTQIAAAVAVLASSPLAFAQSEPQQLQRVEITGSNIKRIDVETSSPVQVINREDIRRTGATSVRELLDALPSTTSGLSDISGSNSFAGGASSVSLRNLGKQATLVLLNFRRVSPYALADFNEVFTNIDSLPIDAIERVEILKNGASAIYGSDAVAGVINIITRKDYRGIEIGGDYQRSTESGKFGQGTVHLSGGFGNYDNDRFNVLANVELFKRDNVIWRDILGHASESTLQRIPKGNAQLSTAGCPPALIISSLCRYDRYSRFEAQPSAERANLLLSGRFKVNQTTEAFAEILYSKTKTAYLSPFQTYGGSTTAPVTWGDPVTGKGRTFFYRDLPATHPLNPTGDEAELRYRFVDGPSEETVKSDNYRALLGLRGTYRNFDWETALAALGASTDDVNRGRFSDSGFKQVIGDYNSDPIEPDFFNKPGGYQIGQPNSAAVLDKLFPAYGNKGSTRQIAWDGKISGEVATLPAGPLGLAAGFDLRHETFKITPSDNLLAGDIVGFGVTKTDAARTYGALFTELNVPVTKEIEAQVAARLDKFPGFDAHLSPKLGLRYQPSKELLLRGTVEGGFRAPNLTESATSTKSSFENGVNDPKRCPQALALAADLRAQSAALPATDPNQALLAARADIVEGNECFAGVANITANNPRLKPEVSRSASLGLVFEPTKEVNVTIDYWNIHRRDEIGLKTTQELLNSEGSLPPGSSISRNSLTGDQTFSPAELTTYGVTAGSLNSITGIFENTAKTKTAGFDVGVTSIVRSPLGKVDLGFLATYLKSYYAYSSTSNRWGNNLAGTYTFPRLSATLSAALTTGPYVNGVRVVHSSGTSLERDFFDVGWTAADCPGRGIAVQDCRVGTTSRLDYFFNYTGVKNLTVGVYVRNVLNRLPPFDIRDLVDNGGGIIPQNREEAQRRTLKVSIGYKFY